ncbi:MAG: PD-(D/E)XK nuclease family protein [Deltaproteobacteria bacterium]|jgi:ATP-dependent helicase/DNAse subunit B|nr:PD-(D/E)XK nuclease family protein [Deltaproteobacteria bacterium]
MHQQQNNWKSLFSSSHFAIGALMIVPNILVYFQLGEEVLAERHVVMGHKVMTFDSLETMLSMEIGPAPVESLIRLMAMNSAAQDIWEPLNIPGDFEPARLIELADQLADGLDRLRLAGVSWETLETLAPLDLTAVLASLGRRYDAWLGDRDDQFSRRRKVLDALLAGRHFKSLAEVEVIYCCRSHRLSPFEAELLKALASQVRVELKLRAPAWLLKEEIPAGTGYHRLRLMRDMEKCQAKGLNLTWAEKDDPDLPHIPEPLRYVSENLFGPKPKGPAPDPTGYISIFSVPYRYHEAEEVCRKIKQLILEGVPSHHIGIGVPSLESYLPALQDVSRRFRLMLRFRQGNPLSSFPAVSALLDLFSLWGSNWELKRLLKVLESPYFNFDLGDTLRPYLNDIGITDNRASGGFKVNFDKITDFDLKEKLRPAYQAVNRLYQAEMTLVSAKTWKSFRDRLQSIVRGLGWPGTLLTEPPAGGYEHAFWAQTQSDYMAIQRMADCLGRLFDSLVNSQHAPPISMDSFKLWLGRAMDDSPIPDPGGPPMGVRVLSYPALHGAIFDALFMMGLNEKVYPSARAEGCWWPEELVQSLAETSLGRRLWSNAAENYQREEDILAQAIGQTRRVFISFQSTTEDQRPALPSSIVESVINLFPEGVLKIEKLGWPLPPPPEKVCEPGELWLTLAVKEPSEVAPDVFLELSGVPVEEAAKRWKSIRDRRDRLKTRLKVLSPKHMESWLATHDFINSKPLLSIAPLQSFAECPRKFWYQHILSLKPWGGPMESWPSTAQGEIVHRSLERFLSPLVSNNYSKNFGPSRLKYIYWELALRHSVRNPIGRKPVFEAVTQRLETCLLAWLKRHKDIARVNIAALEWSFGPNQGHAAPPFEVETPSGSFYLKGRVDRIDWQGGHVVVRDYKITRSSYYKSADKPAEGFRPGWHYPMLLYALAAGRHFKAEPQAVIEFVDPKEGEDHLLIEKGEVEELSELWETLRAGNLSLPEDDGACEFCSFLRLCHPTLQDL